ncbi:hypothetical protein [Gorillibacterium sp. CAU 1737]|uniref:hypothetical protein n=1 Tax=Gorillibacterium sp. CAU 1737 TaxID=3140362 RepID=UPI00325FE7A1
MINPQSLLTFILYPSVDEKEIIPVEMDMGVRFPRVVKELLKVTNGLETEETAEVSST